MSGQGLHFSQYLKRENIRCRSHQTTRNAVIAELVALIARGCPSLNRQKVYEEVMAREEIFPTVISEGLAIPHARIAGLDHVELALATSEEGIDFNVPEMPKVAIVVLILSPLDDPGIHLQILSALAQEMRDASVVERVRHLPHSADIMAFFRDGKVRLPDFLRAHDVMDTKFLSLKPGDNLAAAIRLFATAQLKEIPVIEAESGVLKGVLGIHDLLRFSLPEHLLWMEDLSAIYRFQPFSSVLKTADNIKVADFMHPDFTAVAEDLPAVQLAKLFLSHPGGQLFVVNEKGGLSGIVKLENFAAKLFWE